MVYILLVPSLPCATTAVGKASTGVGIGYNREIPPLILVKLDYGILWDMSFTSNTSYL